MTQIPDSLRDDQRDYGYPFGLHQKVSSPVRGHLGQIGWLWGNVEPAPRDEVAVG